MDVIIENPGICGECQEKLGNFFWRCKEVKCNKFLCKNCKKKHINEHVNHELECYVSLGKQARLLWGKDVYGAKLKDHSNPI